MCVSVCVCVFGFLIDKPLYKGETAVFGSGNRSIRGKLWFFDPKPQFTPCVLVEIGHWIRDAKLFICFIVLDPGI